jgi:ubiquitin-large subunit ribosomal protein L40e
MSNTTTVNQQQSVTVTSQSDPADAVQTIKTHFLDNAQKIVFGGDVQKTIPRDDGKIQLFFKTLTNRTRVIRAKPDATILELKQSFFDSDGVPVDAQRLIWGGKELEDDRTLQDYNIQQEATIYPVLRLRGGGGGGNCNKPGKQKGKKAQKNGSKSHRRDDRDIPPERDDGQEYAKVVDALGDCRFRVRCVDGAEKIAHLCGTLHKRKVRIHKDDAVLISLRPFESCSVQADIIHKYFDGLPGGEQIRAEAADEDESGLDLYSSSSSFFG